MVSSPDDAPAESLGIPEQTVVTLVQGGMTIAEMVGLSTTDLYEIARRAHTMLKAGQVDDAERIYRGLVVASPFDSVFHTHLGVALQAKDQAEEALQHFDLALQFNRQNVEALVGRGELRLKLGRTPEALQDLREAVAADPDAKKPATQRARMMLHMLGGATLKKVAQSLRAAAARTRPGGAKAAPPSTAVAGAPAKGKSSPALPKPKVSVAKVAEALAAHKAAERAPDKAAGKARLEDGFSSGPASPAAPSGAKKK